MNGNAPHYLNFLLSTGCILGGSALGSPRTSGEAVGKKAAEELLEAVETGGTVDKYIQVDTNPSIINKTYIHVKLIAL